MQPALGLLYMVLLAFTTAGADPPIAPRSFTHPTLRPLQLQGAKLLQAGLYRDARNVFEQGLRGARKLAHDPSIARFLSNIGSCELATFQYRSAMRTYQSAAEAAERAEPEKDWVTLAIVYSNMSNIYALLGEVPAAIEAAERALASGSRSGNPFLPALRLRAATLRARAGDFDRALPEIRKAIGEAERQKNELPGPDATPVERRMFIEQAKYQALETHVRALQHLGHYYLVRGDLGNAEKAIADDIRLRRANGVALDVAYLNLARLKQAQGDLDAASEACRSAAESATRARHGVVLSRVHYRHGEIRAAQGKVKEAYREYRSGIDVARRWRLEVLPADAVASASQWELHAIYSRFAETGAELYFRTRRPELAIDTVEALEENRAASLWAFPTGLEGWERRLSPEYGEVLAQVHTVETKLLAEDTPSVRRERDRLRAALVKIETAAGLAAAPSPQSPGSRRGGSLSARLREDQVLVSFHLGEKASYVWAVCHHRTYLRRLLPRATLVAKVRAFSDAARRGAESAATLGADLYRDLFGGLQKTVHQHPNIVLSLDDALFELPFAALVERFDRGRPIYLVEGHELQIVPGAYLLRPAQRSQGAFLGIGDPVYNLADPRWRGSRPKAGNPLPLPRLPGGGREIRACARLWAEYGSPLLLEGSAVSMEAVREAVHKRPAVCHFAVHVLRGNSPDDPSLIALSLRSDGVPELLGPVEISSWRVNAKLVALSGCSSGRDPVLPGAGLTGLTRAWLAAGAGSVIASLWPTPDDAGELFRSFYSQLRQDPVQNPAAALRMAQCEMLRSTNWRASPKYWAAYFTVVREGD